MVGVWWKFVELSKVRNYLIFNIYLGKDFGNVLYKVRFGFLNLGWDGVIGRGWWGRKEVFRF